MKRRTMFSISTVLVLACGYALSDAYDLTPGILTVRAPEAQAAPYPSASTALASPSAVPTWGTDGAYEADQIRSALSTYIKAAGVNGNASVLVTDALTGEVVAEHTPTKARTPASNTKVLTAVAALEVLGSDTTLSTTVKKSGSTLFLVGGGDTLLAAGKGDSTAIIGRAGLEDLATAVKKAGVSGTVNIVVDSSLFSDEVRQQDSLTDKRGYVMEIRPLAVNQSAGNGVKYRDNPDLLAGQDFAAALQKQGIAVSGVTRGTTADGASDVAKVESAPVRDLVDLMLTDSNNTMAETLGHLVAVKKGKAANFDGAAQATMEVLKGLGAPMDGVQIHDNSGLSSNNRVTPALLVDLFDRARTCDGCALEPLASGLPVAGLNGTLDDRMVGTDAAGNVRAKTGTLIEAISLAGYVWTSEHRLLQFAVINDNLENGTVVEAREALDTFMAAIAGA